MLEHEPITQMLGGEVVILHLIVLAIILMFPGAPKVVGQLMILPFAFVWYFGKALFWVAGTLHWYAWRKPRLTRAMWEEERYLRAAHGKRFVERSPIPAEVGRRYGWSAVPTTHPKAPVPAPEAPDDESAFFRSFGRRLGPPREDCE